MSRLPDHTPPDALSQQHSLGSSEAPIQAQTYDSERSFDIDRREALRRVSALLGGAALIGGSSLLAACGKDRKPAEQAVAAGNNLGEFTPQDVAFLDEVADTILPTTSSPGAKAAKVGAFMALMVTDTYDKDDQATFRAGMKKLDEESQKAHNATFMNSTPEQRLALLTTLDQQAKTYTEARDKAREAKKDRATPGPKTADTTAAGSKTGDKYLPDQRQENTGSADVASAAMADDAPPHYFRMIKQLTLLGYFTSEIGYTKAMRYVESPGRFDPCAPYAPGEKAWAPHA